MPANWYVLSLFGADQPGIVAKTTQSLYQIGANLSETSMSRLGDYFTMIMFVEFDGDVKQLNNSFVDLANEMKLQFHFDHIEDHHHSRLIPNIRVSFYCQDRTGLVAQVTAELYKHQVNILNVQSDVTTQNNQPVFIMTIEGIIDNGCEQLTDSIENLKQQGIAINVEPIEMLVG